MYHEDWIMRQIAMAVQSIARIIFNKKTPVYEVTDELHRPNSDALHQHLMVLLEDGLVNEAENLLFDTVNPNSINDLNVAVDFYSRLNEWSDAELELRDFSREEVNSGLSDIMILFDIEIAD